MGKLALLHGLGKKTNGVDQFVWTNWRERAGVSGAFTRTIYREGQEV